MKDRIKKSLVGVVRLGIGLGIVGFLVHSIHTGTVTLTFCCDPVTVSAGAEYVTGQDDSTRLLVVSGAEDGTSFETRIAEGTAEELPAAGAMRKTSGSGPDTIAWEDWSSRPCGLPVLGESFASAWDRRRFLLLAVASFFVCLMGVVVRWQLVLRAQGLELPWKKTCAIAFIGHFFNSFMFGATGGDVVKAYYVARETGHLKTEAVSTVFIDRIVGLLGLLILAGVTMAVRFRFFMEDAKTKYALLFIGAILAGAVGGIVFMFVGPWLGRLVPGAVRLLDTRPGQVFRRAYRSFYVVITHARVLPIGLAISMLNHALMVVMMWALGEALLVDRPFIDYLSLGPTINAIGAVPITPGGLGLRESAMVIFLGVVGVPATKALPLSLMLYASILLWSLVGGVVFLLFTGGDSSAIRDELAHAAEE